MIVHESVLTATQTRVLRAVGPMARRAGFYLAGGTAVALRFGHRRSEDFDWFAPALPRPDSLLSDLQAQGLPLQETQIEAGTVISRIEGLLQNGSVLRQMLEDFREKFKADPISALRGLTYFDDAETEPMPEMLKPLDWRELRAALGQAVREVTR